VSIEENEIKLLGVSVEKRGTDRLLHNKFYELGFKVVGPQYKIDPTA
jgi:hypothetical protein